MSLSKALGSRGAGGGSGHTVQASTYRHQNVIKTPDGLTISPIPVQTAFQFNPPLREYGIRQQDGDLDGKVLKDTELSSTAT